MLTQDEKLLENLISSLKECFTCTDEGPEDGFLGVSFKSTDGQPALNQLQLIKQTIELLNLQCSNPRETPVVKPLLNKNKNDKCRIRHFYCIYSAGSLSYLHM